MRQKPLIWLAGLLIAALAMGCGQLEEDNREDTPNRVQSGANLECPLPNFGSSNSITLDHTVIYDVEDGIDLAATLYIPNTAGPHSAVVMVHGGRWRRANRWVLNDYARYLAGHGLLVMSLDYRLATENNGVTIPDEIRDVTCGVRWLKNQLVELDLQDQCVGIMGDSAGGHLAAMVALEGGRDEFMGSCDDVPDSVDPWVAFALTYYGYFYPGSVDELLMPEGRTTEDYSPINFTERNPETDFLVGIANNDFVILSEQNQDFATALADDGHQVSTIVVDDAVHGFVTKYFNEELNMSIQPSVDAFIRDALAGAERDGFNE